MDVRRQDPKIDALNGFPKAIGVFGLNRDVVLTSFLKPIYVIIMGHII